MDYKSFINEIIISRGLNITDSEFKIKGMIFFGDKILKYRNDVPYIVIGESRYDINKCDLESIVNMAIDYIISKRELNSLDCLNTIEKLKSEIRDRKIKNILV